MKNEESRFAASTVFEGMTSINAVIKAGRDGISDRKIEKILFDKEKSKSKFKELNFLRKVSSELGFSVEESTEEEIGAFTVGNSHGGIIAFCSDRTIDTLTADCVKKDGFYMMIEGIEDPYNFGYALRSIYAAGCDGVVLSPRNWMSAAGVVCRSSAGASELMPLYTSEGENAVRLFSSLDYKTVCAGIRDSVSVYDADLHYPLFMVVGGEKRGISRAVLEACDTVVRLDYGRDFKGSLSAASAASILAYEAFRQNK